MTAYALVEELKEELRVTGNTQDPTYEAILAAVSDAINDYCDRDFNTSTTATARVFSARCGDHIVVDDISSLTDLVIASDSSGTGTYGTTWSANDYRLAPLNNLAKGKPVWRINITGYGQQAFPYDRYGSPLVQVTARWGWPTVPTKVRRACIIQANRIAKRRDAPFGVVASPDTGNAERLLAKLDPDVQQMLDNGLVKYPAGVDP